MISQRMRDLFVHQGFDVLSIDTSPRSLNRGFKYYSARIGRLCQIWRLLSLGPGARIYCYVNAGWGAAIDVLVAFFARIVGIELWLHHHSFNYLERGSRLHRIAFALNRHRSKHIVLCQCMKTKLIGSYDVAPDRVHVVSNANFVEPAETTAKLMLGGPARVGFLSNISEEKGIADFLKLHECLRELPLLFEIAGPVADQRYNWIKDIELQSDGRIRWIGALGEREKAEFLSRVDVLVFPTRYRHEAEPLVLYEAMAHGVAVVAYDRGCVREMIELPHLVARSFDELEAATRSLLENLPDRAEISEKYRRRRERSRRQMSEMEIA